MAITKTPNGTFRVRKKYPKDIVGLLELKNPYFDKIFKTLKEAKHAELEFDSRVQEARRTKEANAFELGGDMSLNNFYKKIWLDAYINGSTSSYKRPPTKPTIKNTEDIFRLHILPMFGAYTLNFLNTHLQFVISKMTNKAKKYANFKTIRSYVNQIFDYAEHIAYIKYNRLSKSLRKIKSLKKIELEDNKVEEDLYLNRNELTCWLDAVKEDYTNGDLTELEYTMFLTTFFLTCRKSECYALQWKHIDLDNDCIYLNRSLDKFKKNKKTKSRKETIIKLPKILKPILTSWKNKQFSELKQLGIQQTPDQYLFTSCDRKGNINVCVHTDFLNYRILKIKKRHSELKHISPHMLRHTSTTLASIDGMALDELSQALTHTDISTTRIYKHNPNFVPQTPAEFIYDSLEQK